MTRQQQSEYDAFPCELAKTPHTALTVTMPTNINDKLISWASEIDEETIRQAQKTARLPIIEGHVALMPDAHVGKGATVGSVIPTAGAVIPSAVGVDIGCGMIAVRTPLRRADITDAVIFCGSAHSIFLG